MFSVDRLPLIEAYASSLASDGVIRGLIGPREVPRLWERHLLNCAVLQEPLPHGASVCDVGSGAGLPGIVLAIARPDLELTLLEPLLRRTTYLSEVVEELGLDNVEVLRGRAEEFAGRRTFDVVTSRAVAPLGRLAAWSMPLVAPTGALVALKGRSVVEEIEETRDELRALGCADPEVIELGAGFLDPQPLALRVAWRDPSRVVLGSAAGSASGGRTKARRKGRGKAARKRRTE
ncbi:16S rRNA (guanine(527)-N(7))-methyltransferase RsmG [Nocardioides sp. AE5]|uniref:16S rRNA (guanine(527)-N(7))-methyltransferase RsmG n=1 Tax=Nocardioides sp. AE5 TaxID=2962573 RepID=UPI0028833F43|nr:16S rRNA (guanine(527)-N(7))-methyltransferase RsmG [Nocardioides sp. AE5]